MKKILLSFFIIFNVSLYSQINAVDDNFPNVDGINGNPNVGNILTNDILNGNIISASQVTIIIPFSGSNPPPPGIGGIDLNFQTGQISVSPGLPDGVYNITYQICSINNPTICDTATITLTVSSSIIANDDSITTNFISTGITNVGNILSNDILNGNQTLISQVNISITTPATPLSVGSSVPSIDVSSGQINIPANTPIGTYYIYYTICGKLNFSYCDVALTTIIVNSFTPLTVSISFKPITSCILNNGGIIINASGGSGGYSYSLNPNIGLQSGNTFSELPAGVYAVTVTDSSGSMFSVYNLIITPSTPLTITNIVTPVTCFGYNDGQIIAIADGAILPYYTYTLFNLLTGEAGSGPQISGIFNNLSTGIYQIQATSNDCLVLSNTIIITEPSTPLSSTATASGQTLTVNATGGTAPYQYSIYGSNNFQTSNTFYDLIPGVSYTFIVKDSRGCMSYTGGTPIPILSTQDFVFNNFKYYPNPVQDSFSLSNATVIDHVSIFNILGEIVLTKIINNTNAALDLYNLTKGIYFVKVKANSQEKVLKIVKD
jgi:Secretion system C-terminal sorting domain/SprB repeat